MKPPVAAESNTFTEPLACRRADFSLPEGVHYLNCAYLGPLPRAAQDAGVAGIARKANPAAGIKPPDFFVETEVLRQLFAQVIHGDPSRVAIIPAVSYGAAIVARNTPISAAQNIVACAEDFPSDMYTWRRLARKTGAALRIVAPGGIAGAGSKGPGLRTDGPGLRGAEWTARVLEAIDADTAIVSVPCVHWADGTRFDVQAIARAARQFGAALVVDGTQSIGALPFDVRDVQPDALLCAGYKWLLGPYSIGVAYFGSRYDDGEPLEENWIARRGSDDFQRLVDYEDEYAPGAWRYDVGERSNFILLPMLIESLRLILELRPERIQEYCRNLVAEPLGRARALGFDVEDEAWRSSHLFGLRTPEGIDLKRLHQALHQRNVFASLRGSALRVAPNVYNDAADLDALIEVLESVVKSG
jgi:selenocysteine lyase/cysteine desulfurase